jgi:hypothetical protein
MAGGRVCQRTIFIEFVVDGSSARKLMDRKVATVKSLFQKGGKPLWARG